MSQLSLPISHVKFSCWIGQKDPWTATINDFDYFQQTLVVESNVKGVAEALHSVTGNIEEYTSEDVEDVADTIHHIADVETVTPEVGNMVGKCIVSLFIAYLVGKSIDLSEFEF